MNSYFSSAAFFRLKKYILPVIATTLSGTLGVFSFSPFDYQFIAFFSLAILFYLVYRQDSLYFVFAIVMAYSFSFFIAGLWWIFLALVGHIGLPVFAGLLIIIAFCLFLSLFSSLLLVLACWLANTGIVRLLSIASCWVLGEWLRSWVLTGFPWLSWGYSQIPDGIFSAWAPILGILGVSLAMTLFIVSALGIIVLKGGRIVCILTIFFLVTSAPIVNKVWPWTTPGGKLEVSLLQGNIQQSLKWNKNQVIQALSDYQEMIKNATGRLIILPETAWPVLLSELSPEYIQSIHKAALDRYGMVIGGVFVEEEGKIYNAAAIFENKKRIDIYKKAHLTPYGEYLPFAPLISSILGATDIPFSQLSPGERSQSSFVLMDGITAGLSICYEDLFGEEWRYQMQNSQFLINLTNDSWFDGSLMPSQHLQVSQARALESGKWLVRSTNTGVTAIINGEGKIVKKLPVGVRGALHETIELYRGSTPYTFIGDKGIVIILMILLLSGQCFLFYCRWKKGRS